MADYILLALATPFALWAAWSDLRYMRIPNELNNLAGLAFILVMPFFLPLDNYGLRIAVGGYVLIAGFILNAAGVVGGGDAKFATVMVPYVAPGEYLHLLMAYLAAILVTFALHRLVKFTLAGSPLLDDWASFHTNKFPMGLPMALALLVYLVFKAFVITPI
jgi:prepilin peptidase CpaA